MAPQFSSVHLVGDASSPQAVAARAAAKACYRGATIRYSPNLSAATAAAPDGLEVLVLLNPAPEDFKIALTTLDPRGFPRWAVVPPSSEDAALANLGADGWEVPALTRAIGFAVSLLALRRDNARLTGDLHTVGRRFTHDLRTPLNSIHTANQALAALTTATEPAPSLHESISLAVEETGGLIERVGTVLCASARPIGKQPVEMEEIVWNARERLDARIRAAGATIVAPEKWPVASGVAAWLEIVWINLLSNSVQHGGPALRIQLGWTRAEDSTSFWVRDSGAGVALAKRARLYHPLDRLAELNAPRGYGLSLVHRLIELHGGTTGYTPEPPPGGTFYFTLPEPG